MIKSEKIVLLLEKADALISWFDGRQLPKGVTKIAKGWTLHDAKLYLKTQVDTMAAYRTNPYSKAFVSAFKRLLKLKEYIENVELLRS